MRLIALLCVLACPIAGLGNDATPPASQPDESGCPCPLAERPTLTDDWFTLGRPLSDKGLTVRLGMTQIYQQNLRGGLSTHRRAGRYSGSYDLELEGDLEKLVRWPGGTLYALAEGGWSRGLDPSSVGSLFGVNGDADDDQAMFLSQLYYEQALWGGKVRVRLGKADLTGTFQCHDCPASFDGNSFANDPTSQFLNGALANNPTIPFPDPGLAAVVHVFPTDGFYLSAAVADAHGQARETGLNTAFHGRADFFSVFEAGLLPRLGSANGPLQGAYRAGLWYDPQPKDRLDGQGIERDDVGWYLSFDQKAWNENATGDGQGVGLFARFGWADGHVNPVRCFWSVGGQYQGLIPGRDDDVLAVGVAQGRASRHAEFTESHETALEVYYRLALTPWLSVTPSVQYIRNPGADKSVDDAMVVGVRIQIDF